jgi:hypothetical protein
MERRNANRAVAVSVFVHSAGFPPFEPNWISFRSSRRNIHRRADRGDIAPTCPGCLCESDVTPVPHSPRCTEPAPVAGPTPNRTTTRGGT